MGVSEPNCNRGRRCFRRHNHLPGAQAKEGARQEAKSKEVIQRGKERDCRPGMLNVP